MARLPAYAVSRLAFKWPKSSLEADSQEEARTQLDDLRERLEEKAPSALETLEEGFYDATAVLALPEKYRKRLRTTNMLERSVKGDQA